MRTFVIIIIFIFVSIVNILAQSLNVYKETKTFYQKGYTYQCDVPSYKVIRLYNKENKFTYENQINKETGELFNPPLLMGNKKIIVPDLEMSRKARRIVDNAFSIKQAERFKEYELLVIMYLSPETGKVIEVRFDFPNFGPYATIPISVYRGIEVDLKASIRFVPDEVGKRLNYIMLGWGQIPKGSDLQRNDLPLITN